MENYDSIKKPLAKPSLNVIYKITKYYLQVIKHLISF